jgi:amidase
MIILDSEHVIYEMSKENKPIARCQSGDTIMFHTLDCFSNTLLPETARLGVDNHPPYNPATGPLYIEGAVLGDTLKVEIIDITVGNVGINIIGPSSKYLSNKLTDYEIRRFHIVNGKANIFDNLSIPIEPMIGVIGVAPLENAESTGMPGYHGGNMDCKQIKKGAVLYLPVFTDGALLALGDIHALMGDGEIGECGLEIEGTVIIRVSVLHGTNRNAPAVCVDGKWITISSCKTLDAAAEEATDMMLNFLMDEKGMKANDAGILLSLCGNLAICQNCNGYKTVRMELSLNVVPDNGFNATSK